MTVETPTDPIYKVLVIDDERWFTSDQYRNMVAYARNSDDALDCLSRGIRWNQVWFDHDLGPDDDIRRVVEWLEAEAYFGRRVDIGCCYIQSRNPVGIEWIKAALEKHYKVIVSQNEQLVATIPKWVQAYVDD